MTISIYNTTQELPTDDTVEVGDVAFVKENYNFYSFLDLSLEKTYSYVFGGISSYLDTVDVLSSFTDSADEFTIEFWTYNGEAVSYPVFSIENTNYEYYVFDELENSLTIGGAPKTFFISPYDSDLTSVYLNGINDYIRADSIQPLLSDVNNPYKIEYWTRASNTSFTLFSANKLDRDEPILKLNSNNIVVNGVTLSGNISYGKDSWQHNLLKYDGFDYKFYKNGDEIPLTRSPTSYFDSTQELNFTSLSIDKDAAFECKVTIPSNPTDGVLFELGGENNRLIVQIEGGGTTLSISGGKTTINLKASTTDFPKDDQEHIISWDVQINPGRVRLWIDGVLKAEKTHSAELENGIWCETDRSAGSLPAATSFQRYSCSPYVSGPGKWTVYMNYRDYLMPNNPVITKNGDQIKYFELKYNNVWDRYYLYMGIIDPNAFSSYRYDALRFSSYYNSRWAYLYAWRDAVLSFLIVEPLNRVYFFINGSYWYNTPYSNVTANDLRIAFASRYCGIDFTCSYYYDDWKYKPYELLSKINLGPEGAYGSKIDDTGRSLYWPGELNTNLMVYPQAFGSLKDGSLYIGGDYKPSTEITSARYKGYINDFNLSSYDLNDSSLLDSIQVPTISKIEDSNTDLLIKTDLFGGTILAYNTDGTLIKNGNTIQLFDSQYTNTWDHIALVYNGEQLKAFKNGQLKFEDSIDFRGYSLSDGQLDIGRITNINYNTASYVSRYYKDNISDFRIRKEVVWDSNFIPPVTYYPFDDSNIILTCNAGTVEDDDVIQNISSVDAVELSPFSASTKTWFQTGLLSSNIVNVTEENNHLLYHYDSYYEPNTSAISGVIELRNKDDNDNTIVWTPDFTSINPTITIKQIDNRFLLEPILFEDSYAERFEYVQFNGLLENDSTPVLSTAEGLELVGGINFGFAYFNADIRMEQNNNIFVSDFFSITKKDSAIDSDFRNITPLTTYTPTIPMQLFDSIGELP